MVRDTSATSMDDSRRSWKQPREGHVVDDADQIGTSTDELTRSADDEKVDLKGFGDLTNDLVSARLVARPQPPQGHHDGTCRRQVLAESVVISISPLLREPESACRDRSSPLVGRSNE